MGVLSKRELVAARDDGRLRIDPRPEPGPESRVSPFNVSSVDLRTGRVAETPATICDQHLLTESGFVLDPNRFILGQTIERVGSPLAGRLAARIEGRSSFARTGLLVHFIAPPIHAGFEGTITLEIINLGPLALVLTPEFRICQPIATVPSSGVESIDLRVPSLPTSASSPCIRRTRPARRL